MTIIDIFRIRGIRWLFSCHRGASSREEEGGERGWKTGVSPSFESILFFFFSFLFFSPFFFLFFLLSLPLPLPFAILLVCEAIHARMVTNDGGGGVKMEKVEVAAMRSVEMIRTVEQVGGRAIEIFAGN